jgi:RNA polymerase sigma-70 factor, ECF subfamily
MSSSVTRSGCVVNHWYPTICDIVAWVTAFRPTGGRLIALGSFLTIRVMRRAVSCEFSFVSYGTEVSDASKTVTVDVETRVAGSFDAFFRREQRGLVALGYALTGSRTAAEDIAQDALVAANRRWDRVGQLDSPIGWTRRVVANRSTSFIRRRINEAKALSRVDQRRNSLEDGSMPSESEHMWRLIRRLPRRQAQVVTLKALHQLSLQEIADVLGVSKETVQTHLLRARTTLTRQLETEIHHDRP